MLMTFLLAIAVTFALSYHVSPFVFAQPSLTDSSLTTELVVGGLSSPTSIAFLDNNNIMLLEKGGNVRLISNGQMQPEPLLQLEGVESNNKRGLLGIDVMKSDGNDTFRDGFVM
jgi:glucose/arabinose dehydrogenase